MSHQKPRLKDPFWLFSGLATLLLAGVLLMVHGSDHSGLKGATDGPEFTAKMNVRVLP